MKKKKCNWFMKTDKIVNTILESHLGHSHKIYKYNIMGKKAKRKMPDDICKRPLKLICNEP